jgi:hypothetical protein
MAMHLGVTGTKEGLTEKQFNVFIEMLSEMQFTHLHQGDCVGVDNEVTIIVRHEKPEVIIVRHPPIKKHYQAFGPYDETWPDKDYLVRDQDNVNCSDYMFAFPKGEEVIRSGTWTTVRYARKKGIPITIIMPNGEVRYE